MLADLAFVHTECKGFAATGQLSGVHDMVLLGSAAALYAVCSVVVGLGVHLGFLFRVEGGDCYFNSGENRMLFE